MTRRLVAEITLVTGAGGATSTILVATSGWCTLPTDIPADSYIPARLLRAGTLVRELFSGRRVMGAVRPSFGELVIINNDGAYDAWLAFGSAGGAVLLRWGDEDAAYPGGYTTIFVAQVHSIRARMDALSVRLRDGIELLDRPIVASSFTGAGGLEGASAVAGRLKQWVSSDPGYIEPVLIDAAAWLYFVQSTGAGGLGSYFKLYAGGVEMTRGADYTSVSDCTSNAPAAGQCRFWFGSGGGGPVYFRLAAGQTFDLRVQAFGYQPSGAAWTLPALAALAGLPGGTGSLVVGAQLVDDGSTTYAEVMADACVPRFGYFGVSRLGVFLCGTFDVPGALPLATFDQHNAWDWSRDAPNGMDLPVWQVSMAAGDTWPSNLQAAAADAQKDYLTRRPKWCSFAGNQSVTLTDNPGADSQVLKVSGRHFQNLLDQTNFLTGYFARHGVRRDFWTCTTQMTDAMLALELNDVVEVRFPRYNLGAGRNMRVITQRINCDAREIVFGLWG